MLTQHSRIENFPPRKLNAVELYFCPNGNIAQIIGRKDFSEDKRKKIRALHALNPRWNFVILLHFALWLFTAWIAVNTSIFMLDLVCYVVAGLALGTFSVLTHESAHRLLTRNAALNRVLGFVCGLPILFSASAYRVVHPIHHAKLRTPEDPDDFESTAMHFNLLAVVYIITSLCGVSVGHDQGPARRRGFGKKIDPPTFTRGSLFMKTTKTHGARLLFAVMMLAIAALALNGCTVIFGTAGLMADAQKSSPSAQEVGTMKPDAAFKLMLKNGIEVNGRYAGLERISVAEYAVVYSQARAQKPEGVHLPASGEEVAITTNTKLFAEFEKELLGTFEGFDHERILTKLQGTTVLTGIPLSVITRLAGHALSGETIKRLIRAGPIPVMTAIVVESEAGKTRVAMNNVRRIETPAKKHAALQGFLMGAMIDAIVVIAVREALSEVDFSFNFMGQE